MTPTDPLYVDQWHFALIGDIETIWEEYDGTGVHVGVYDDGVDYDHVDLDDNYDDSLFAVDDLDAPLDGFPELPVDGHGTSVAGLIAAEANNGNGGVGVAHGATVSAVNIFDATQYGFVNGDQAAFMDVASQAVMFDISSNSWGATPLFSSGLDDGGFADVLDAVYEDVVRDGRGGLGTIITQAAGNDDMDANGDGVNVSRFTITVAATDINGDAAYYSNFGASILIAAPAAALTTDVSGANGYDPGDYTDQFGGTSAATPVTSGVIALMLDANAGLGWRDVQNILAASATLTGSAFNATAAGPEEEETWQSNEATTWNGGGYHIHANYGYGMIDAFAAVRMAEVWNLFTPAQVSANEVSVSGRNNFADVTVGSAGVTRNVTVNQDVAIEHVQLTLEMDSDQLMDLEVLLTSPDGTTITVAFSDSAFIAFDDDLDGTWTYGIDGLRGESSQGVWKVEVVDDRAPGKVTVLESAEVTVYGKAAAAGDVYHVTDEYLQMKRFEGSRGTIRDTNGGLDWLNFAAVTSDMRIDHAAMTFGTVSKIWGRMEGSIEHVVMGDGDDTVIGSGANNKIYGMRGNDTLRGESGNDTMDGGAGDDNMFGGIGNDWVTGGAGNDVVRGEAGTDTLVGSTGTDNLRGGQGNDVYFHAVGASLVEVAGGGSDKVYTSLSLGLSVEIEKLVLQGTDDIFGTGNGSANTIWGNAADNSLNGAAGNDTLLGGGGNDRLVGGNGNDVMDGGAGNDVMSGGAGADVFKFTTALSGANVDEITDFRVGVDKIHLENAVFVGLAAGAMSASAFTANAAGVAQDRSDRIIYETDTGFLFYDSNGSAAGGAVKFAELAAGLALTSADFFVI
jgi:subtilisin-like proprotein convertase family protein